MNAASQIAAIQRIVADEAGIDRSEMTSARRSRSVARPRQIAMTLACALTGRSLPVIGRHFGGRDHTTIVHARNVITKLCATDAAFRAHFEGLRGRCAAALSGPIVAGGELKAMLDALTLAQSVVPLSDRLRACAAADPVTFMARLNHLTVDMLSASSNPSLRARLPKQN